MLSVLAFQLPYAEPTSGGGIDGAPLQGLSPQAAIQADTISITSSYQFVRSMNQRMERLFARGSSANTHYANKQSSFMLRTSSTTGAPSANAYGFVGPFGLLEFR